MFRQRIQAELARIRAMTAKIDIGFNLDTAYLRGQLTYVVRKAARGIEAHIRVRWVPSVAVLRAELEALVRAAQAGLEVNIPVRFNQKGRPGGGGIGGLLSNPFVITGALAAIQPAIQAAYGLATALQNLLPLLLAVPGALLSIGAVGLTAALGFKGFGDALKGDAKALASLAPEAKASAQALLGFKSQWKDLQQTVQNELFEGLAKDFKQLGTNYIPILNNGLRLIGGQLNKIGKGFLTALNLPQSRNSVANILESTRRSMIGLGPATSNFTQSILRLGEFGAKQFEKLGLSIQRASEKFALWVDEGTSTGRFQEMFDKAVQTAKDLWSVLKNIAGIISAIVKGMNQGFDNQSFLSTLAKNLGQIKDTLNTKEAQDGLKGLGQALSALSTAVKDILLAALKELSPIMRDLGPVFEAFFKGFSEGAVDGIRILGEVLGELAGWLRENKDLIGAIAPALGHLAVALLAVKIGKGVITALRNFGRAVGGLRWLGKVGLWWGIYELASALDRMNMAAAGGDENKLNYIDDQLHNILGAFKEIISLNFEGIFADLNEEFRMLEDGPMGQFGSWVNYSISQTIADMTNFGTFINGKIDEIVQWFGELPGKITAGLAGWGEVMFGESSRAIGEFARGAAEKFNEFTIWLAGLPGRIVNFFTGLPGMLFGSGTASFGGFQGGATGKVGEIIAWVGGIPGRLLGALGNLGGLLVQAGRNLMSGLLGGIVAGLAPIISYVSRIAAWIRSVKGPKAYDLKVLRDPGLWMMQGLHGGLKDGLKPILKDVSGYAEMIGGQFSDPIDVKVKGNIPNMANGSYTADLAHSVTADGFGIDYDRLATAMENRPVELQADGRAIATVVNKSNTRKNRR